MLPTFTDPLQVYPINKPILLTMSGSAQDGHVNGATTAAGEEPPKTAKQLEKEAAKAAKLAKLAAKTEKKAQQPTTTKEKAPVSC